MSPEQVDFRDLDHRADVFSVGVVLWEMLTGQRLFYRVSEYETVRAVVACHVPFARFVEASIPWTLSLITHRALRRSPRWRYRDARDMSRALRAWDGREPAQARDDLAQWLGSLFGDELRVREHALARARRDPTRHRQIQDAGFELVDEASLEAVRPPPRQLRHLGDSGASEAPLTDGGRAPQPQRPRRPPHTRQPLLRPARRVRVLGRRSGPLLVALSQRHRRLRLPLGGRRLE
jgi:hypothetical protein